MLTHNPHVLEPKHNHDK